MFDGTAESMRQLTEAIIYKPHAISDDLVKMRTIAANKNSVYYKILAQHVRHPGPDLEVRLATKGRFDRLAIPGIYLFGRDDVMIPVEAGYLQEDACPNVQFFYPSECGHQGQSDQPELFNQVFLEFFRDGRVSRDTAINAGVSTRRPELPNLVAEA
jgi:pimeloyl-ACP methyl ester carboxylesterase